jgi:hypothetical protein
LVNDNCSLERARLERFGGDCGDMGEELVVLGEIRVLGKAGDAVVVE